MRAVVIGGLGNFGTRICRRLTLEKGIEVIATGRNADARLAAGKIKFARLDIHDPGFASALKGLRPDLVIHAGGKWRDMRH